MFESYNGRSLSDRNLSNCSLSNCCNIDSTHGNYSHSDCTHSATTAAPVSAVAVTAAVTAVILPSHSYFQSRGSHLSGYGHNVHSHSSRTYTGYSLSHSSHSGLHAAVVGRVANIAVMFCGCKSDLSQFTHSEYNALDCRLKDHGHSLVCM